MTEAIDPRLVWARQRKADQRLVRSIHEYENELRRNGVRGQQGNAKWEETA